MKKSEDLINNWFKNKNKILFPDSGEKEAISLFRKAALEVPAYRDFLKKNHFNPENVKTFSDFKRIPITTKENYFSLYPANSLCWGGKFDGISSISTSSGTTGNVFYWPRSLKHEIDGAYPHEYIFNEIFDVLHKSTLFINAFPLGNWIAGTFTSACVNLYLWKNGNLTVMSPGYDLKAVIDTILHVSHLFEQTIIAGHSPFLKEIIDQAKNINLDWSKVQPKFLGTGQAITESWRKYLVQSVGSKDYYRTFISLYGSADASLMGFEIPYSICLRQQVSEKGMQKRLFNDERIPSIVAYDPRLTFIESINNELCITKNSGAPLVRYNIQDEGNIINRDRLEDLPKNKFKSDFPLVYLFGRAKFMVKVYGANIYSEHVQAVLDHEKLQPHLTGRFILETEFDEVSNQQLICRVELNSTVNKSSELELQIKNLFIETVRRLNSEYNYVLTHVGEHVKPRIVLHSHGDEKYFPVGKLKKNA